MRGYHEPGTGEIVIDASPDFPPAARADRLIYELANLLIDEDPRRRGLKFCDGEKRGRSAVGRLLRLRLRRLHGNSEPIAVPAEWSVESAVAVRYAAVVDRVAGALKRRCRRGWKGAQR